MYARIAILSALLASGCAWASDTPMDRETLKGLKAVKVVVDPTGKELEAEGITAESLRARIERALETAGIPLDPNAREFVGARLMAAHSKRMPWALSMSLELYQTIALDRDPKIKTTTETWSTQTVVMAPVRQLEAAVDDSIAQLAKQFVAAWQSVH